MPQVWVQIRSLFVPFNSCTHMHTHTHKKIITPLKYMVWISTGINFFYVTEYSYWFTTLVSSRPGIPRGKYVAAHKSVRLSTFGLVLIPSSFSFFFFSLPRKWNFCMFLNSVEFILFICWQNMILKLAGGTQVQTGKVTWSHCRCWFYKWKKITFSDWNAITWAAAFG